MKKYLTSCIFVEDSRSDCRYDQSYGSFPLSLKVKKNLISLSDVQADFSTCINCVHLTYRISSYTETNMCTDI